MDFNFSFLIFPETDKAFLAFSFSLALLFVLVILAGGLLRTNGSSITTLTADRGNSVHYALGWGNQLALKEDIGIAQEPIMGSCIAVTGNWLLRGAIMMAIKNCGPRAALES